MERTGDWPRQRVKSSEQAGVSPSVQREPPEDDSSVTQSNWEVTQRRAGARQSCPGDLVS